MDKAGRELIRPMRVRMPPFNQGAVDSEHRNDPNLWFARLFPEAAQKFGPAFMVATCDDASGLTRIIPLELNEDAWAYALAGDRKLGHRLIFYPSEEVWYFFDYRVDAFCPTTEAKLHALISSFLIRCSQEVGSLVEIGPIVTDFRKPSILRKVVDRANALLAADAAFFQTHRRLVDGRMLDPNADPTYLAFVKETIVRQRDGKLTLPNAFHCYYRFCKDRQEQPLKRQEFKHLFAEAVRERFKIGLRHDVPSEEGRDGHGWFGISCLLDSTAAVESQGDALGDSR